ncbi:TPA: restriction endonuclease subunit S [Streptococcus suis]
MPNKDRNIPKRRFKEFENADAWELRKLGEVAEINPKSQVPETFEYVDLESVVGTNLISHRTESVNSAPSRAQRLALYGDIFYQTVRPYQKNNYLFDLPYKNYVFSTGYAQLRPKIDSHYLMIKIQDDGFVKEVLDRCTGTSYPAINSKDLSQISIDVPVSLPEQKAIGTFFSNLDRQITLHQRKLDKLKNVKQAYLSEMFPAEGERVPKRRFPGFTDAWELRKLGEVAEIITGTTPSTFDEENYGGKRLFVSPVDIQDNRYITETLTTLTEKGHLLGRELRPGATLFVSIGSTIGKVAQLKDFATSNQQINAVISGDKIDDDFIFTGLEKKSAQIKNLSSQQAVPIINKSTFSNIEFEFPTLPEQKAIGTFFSTLDRQTTLHQRKLEKLKNLKKALLNELFV